MKSVGRRTRIGSGFVHPRCFRPAPRYVLRGRREITTKAVRVSEFGGTDKLQVNEVELPELKDGDILIKNEFAGLNFIDTYQRSGLYKVPLPATLGVDGAGVVEAVTPAAKEKYGIKEGDRVCYNEIGSYAQHKILPAHKAVPVPEEVGLDVAAACMVQGMTAHYLARSTFELKEGRWCVVHAAAGGVGQILVQIAKMCGARVISTASSDEKIKLALEHGSDYAVKYDDLIETVRTVIPEGVHVVYDGVGKNTWESSLQCLRPRGLCVNYGNASGVVPDFDILKLAGLGSLYITRPTISHYTHTREELLWRARDLFSWIAQEQVKINIDRVYELKDVPEAHKYIESGQTLGKVVFKC